MRTIYKYRLPRDGQSIIIEEYIIEVLHIEAQDGQPTLWAVVDTEQFQETEVVAWGTGWPLPDDVYFETDYWGSAIDGIGYVWHYFAATRSSARNYWDSADTSSDCAPTITINCDGDNYSTTTLGWNDPSIIASTAITGTISTDTYNDREVTFDKLIGMVEKYVGSSNTAINKRAQ